MLLRAAKEARTEQRRATLRGGQAAPVSAPSSSRTTGADSAAGAASPQSAKPGQDPVAAAPELDDDGVEEPEQAAPTFGGPAAELEAGAARGNVRLVKKALKDGASAAALNSRKTTPLMLACASNSPGSMEVVKALLDAQSDANRKDYQGWSGMHYACRDGNRAVVALLLGHRALAASTADQKSVLMLAAMGGHQDVVEMLVSDHSIRQTIPETDLHGQAAMHFACRSGNDKIVKDIASSRGKVGCRDNDGRQPLHVASEAGAQKVVKYLVGRGAKVNQPDSISRTPLHYACAAGMETLALWLVEKHADPEKKSMEGVTPLQIATAKGLSRLIKLALQSHWEKDMAAAELEDLPDA